MTSAIRARRNEEGFTLIELLVVVIIIGILAAIAIPAFLNQRERAWESELTSTVRNIALDVESEATRFGGDYSQVDNGGTTTLGDFIQTSLTTLQGAAATPVIFANTVDVDFASSTTAFEMCMSHAQLATTVTQTYASASGGLATMGTVVCNVTDSASL